MFCSHCGKSIHAEDVNCPHCGAALGEERFEGNMYTAAQAHEGTRLRARQSVADGV